MELHGIAYCVFHIPICRRCPLTAFKCTVLGIVATHLQILLPSWIPLYTYQYVHNCFNYFLCIPNGEIVYSSVNRFCKEDNLATVYTKKGTEAVLYVA